MDRREVIRNIAKAATILSIATAGTLAIAVPINLAYKKGIENYIFQLSNDGRTENYVVRNDELYRLAQGGHEKVLNPELKEAMWKKYASLYPSSDFRGSLMAGEPRKISELEAKISYVHVRDFVTK